MKKILKFIDQKIFNKFFSDKISRNKFKYASLTRYSIQNYFYWQNHFLHISENKIPGDIYEFGVGNGHSLSLILMNFLENKNKFIDNKKIYAFDSFAGFPEPSIEDHSNRNPKKKDWSHTSEIFVKNNLSIFGFSEKEINNITFVKGYFEDTLLKHPVNDFSLMHLDCDLYKSYEICLNQLNKINKNFKRIVCVDEYGINNTNFKGADKAINNFLIKKGISILESRNSKNYFFY